MKHTGNNGPAGGCVGFLFLGAFGGFMLYLGIKGITKYLEMKKSCTEQTTATVFDRVDYSDLGDNIRRSENSISSLSIRYSINGEIYEQPLDKITNGVRTSGMYNKYSPGTSFEILYDPNDHNSILPVDKTFLKTNILVTAIGGALILGAFVILKVTFM